MKRILFGIGAVFVLLVCALVIAPFLVPNSVYKTRIEQAAQQALGRDVRLNGGVSLGIFPRISASVADVEVDNPEGFPEPVFATADSLKASVRWMPLFSPSRGGRDPGVRRCRHHTETTRKWLGKLGV